MSLHVKIVATQLILLNINTTITSRQATETAMKNNIFMKVTELKSIQSSNNKTLENYHQCYMQWEEQVQIYEAYCSETKTLSATKSHLECYIQQLIIDYTP